MPGQWVTVFGGTGYLGRHIVEALRSAGCGVRVAARRADAGDPRPDADGGAVPVRADLRDAASLAAALEGAQSVVNAVGLYVERGGASFQAVHVEGAGRLAEMARHEGVERLVHISGIGADVAARSAYVRARGEGEAVVRRAFPAATVLRPSVLFGPDDAFLTTLAALVRRLPVIPLFGRGETRLQPVFVGDVAAAAARAASEPGRAGLYELGGPEILSYRALLERVMERTGRRRPLLPVPFPVWQALAFLSGVLPAPPVTEGMVALMKRDNLVAESLPGLRDLGVTPSALDPFLQHLSERGP